MTPGITSKPYADIVDEWLQAKRNNPSLAASVEEFALAQDNAEGVRLRSSAYTADPIQQMGDFTRRILSSTPTEALNLAGANTKRNFELLGGPAIGRTPQEMEQRAAELQPGQVRAQDVTADMGRSMGSIGDLIASNSTSAAGQISPQPMPVGSAFADIGETVGRSVPEMATTAPLLAGGPVGLGLATLKTGAEAYSPQADPIRGTVAGVTNLVAPGVVGAAERIAGGAAARAMFPAIDDLVAQTPKTYGQSFDDIVRTAIDPSAASTVGAARLAGGVAGGTALNETSRQVESLARGEGLAAPSVEALVGDVAGNIAFSAPLVRGAFGRQETTTPVGEATPRPTAPFEQLQRTASNVVKQAEAGRASAADARGQRGERVAAQHRLVLDALERGQDPTAATTAARSEFVDAYGEATPERGLESMRQFAREAESGQLSDDSFHRLVAGVQGRFEDTFKADPSGTPYGTVETLIDRGLLPKLSKQWIEENYGQAVEMMNGDVQGAKANLINRIYAEYQQRLPGALEQMRATPAAEGMSKTSLDAASEADKDALYMQSLARLYPNMKDARVPYVDSEGVQRLMPLAQAMWAQDQQLSAATQGGQLDAEATAWRKYDAWKNAVIRMAETYDPTTRQGVFMPAKRMADGEYVELPGRPVTLEDMVQPDFAKSIVPTRKYGAATRAMRGTQLDALSDAVEFVHEKFANDYDEEDYSSVDRSAFEKRKTEIDEELLEDVTEPADDIAAKDLDILRSELFPAQGNTVETTTDKPSREMIALWREATAGGLTGADRARYVQTGMERIKQNDKPAFGVSLPQSNREDFYDVAIHLMNKVSKASNAELWTQYGGERLFGKGAKSPGKFDLFKSALLARMESEMDDTGQLTAAQRSFYEAWRANNSDASPIAKDWREQRQQFRHAMRLYWAKGAVSMPDLFMSMLADKPKYQAMLQGQKQKPQAEMSVSDSDPDMQKLTQLGYQIAPDYDGSYDITGPDGEFVEFDETPKEVQDLLVALETKLKAPQARNDSLTTGVNEGTDTYVGMRTPLVDALRLFKGHALRNGLDEKFANEAATIAGKMVQAFDEVAGVGKLVGDPGTLGVNIASETMGGPTVGINFDLINAGRRQEVTKSVRALQVLAHELAHNYSTAQSGQLARNQDSAYKQQRVDAYAKMHAMFNSMGLETTQYLLNEVLPEVFFPTVFRPQTGASLTHGDFGQEAISRFMEFVMLGAMTKDNPWQSGRKGESLGEAFKWLPDDMQAFTHLALRDLNMFAGGVQQYLRFGGRKTEAEVFQHLLNTSGDFIRTHAAQQLEYRTAATNMLARLGDAGANDWTDPTIISSAYDLDDSAASRIVKDSPRVSLSLPGKDVLKDAMDTMFGNVKKLIPQHEKRLGVQVPPWSRYLGLFYQAMDRYQKAGVPIAENVSRMVNDLEPSYFRLTRMMHDPFLTTDAQGRLVYNPDHPVQYILQNKTPEAVRARGSLNELYLWQNEHATPVTTRDPDGKLVVNPKASVEVQKKMANYSPKTQQAVLEGLDALGRGYTAAADLTYNAQVENTGVRVAGIFMTMERTLGWDDAFRKGQAAVEAAIGWTNAQAQLADAQKQGPLAVQMLQPTIAAANDAFGKMMMALTPQEQGVVRDYLLNSTIPAQKVNGVDMPAKVEKGMAQRLLDLGKFFDKRSGWFGSETRPGRFFLASKTPGPDSVPHYTSAPTQQAANKLAAELAKEGHTDFRLLDRQNKDEAEVFAQPDHFVKDFMNTEARAWDQFLAAAEQQLGSEDMEFLKSLGYVPGAASEKKINVKGLERYMQPRELTAGRERLDAFEVFQDYTGRLSGTIARKGLRGQLDLLLRDPRVRNQGQFKQTVNDAIESMMTPVDDRFVAARAAMTAYYLGLPNVVSPLIEGMQSTSSILPYIISKQGFTKGVKNYASSVVGPADQYAKQNTLAGKRLLASAASKALTDPSKMTKEEAIAHYYKLAGDEGGFQYGPIYSTNLSRDHQMLTQQAFGLGTSTPKTREQLVTDPIYWAAQKTMWLYSHMSAYNSRVGMLSALDMLYDQGLRGNELYTAASAFKNLATFGGGKANAIGFTNTLSNPTTRSAFSLIETLQRYVYGNMTMFKDFAADMMGRTDLSKAERVKAAQAFGTALGSSMLLAGALGIPGFAIGSAIVSSMTGGKVDPKQQLREFMFKLAQSLGADDPLAVTMANYAQNGVVSNFMGVDVSNRMSVNSILGFNSFDGFNTSELFGVGSSIVGGMIDGTKYAANKEFVKAGKSVAPPSWRPYIDLAESKVKYGDTALRDASNRMITPLTGGESVQYALGLRPQRYRHFRDQQAALMTAEKAAAGSKDHRLDMLAQDLLKGNNASVMEFIQQSRSQNPLVDPRSQVKSVIDRAVDMSRPIDLMSDIQSAASPRAAEIRASFGNVAAPRQSELQDLMTRTKLNATTGFMAGPPPTNQDVERAALIDALVQQRGLDRGEAVRMATAMGY